MARTLVLCRHGECEWNEKDLFCGWYDSPLTKVGKEQAHKASVALRDYGIQFGRAHTSLLSRAIETCEIILHETEQDCVPVSKNWRLNERHYGALTGLNKIEIANEFGEEQVRIWRRSYNCPPPAMDCQHKYFNEIVYDSRYESDPPRIEFPLRESLEKTIERVIPYWNDVILKDLKSGLDVLVVAHGKSLVGIIKVLEKMSNQDIAEMRLPCGVPFVYKLNEHFVPKEPVSILGGPEILEKASEGLQALMAKKHDSKKIMGLTC